MKPMARFEKPLPISPVRRLGALAAAITTATISTVLPAQAVPPLLEARWPDWAKDLAKSRQAGDVGLGDTTVHVVGDEASERFQTWFNEKIGTSCGCKKRQAWLNRRFPFL
jgi:hypothetical protein